MFYFFTLILCECFPIVWADIITEHRTDWCVKCLTKRVGVGLGYLVMEICMSKSLRNRRIIVEEQDLIV